MPELAGIGHASLSVTDLDRSERFYTDVLGLFRLADFGTVRILLHRQTSLILALVHHDAAHGGPFSELRTGLDHLGFAVTSRDELVAWERHLEAHGVPYTPIRDMEFGAHLNFRDPDDIALELNTSNEILTGWFNEFRERDVPRAEIDARLAEYLASPETDPDPLVENLVRDSTVRVTPPKLSTFLVSGTTDQPVGAASVHDGRDIRTDLADQRARGRC